MKIDVEGHEFEVLSGAMRCLEDPELLLMLEITKKNLDDHRHARLGEVLERVYSKGFRASFLERESRKLVEAESVAALLSYQASNFFLVVPGSRASIAMQNACETLRQRADIAWFMRGSMTVPNGPREHRPFDAELLARLEEALQRIDKLEGEAAQWKYRAEHSPLQRMFGKSPPANATAPKK